jgi:hypothetical protein
VRVVGGEAVPLPLYFGVGKDNFFELKGALRVVSDVASNFGGCMPPIETALSGPTGDEQMGLTLGVLDCRCAPDEVSRIFDSRTNVLKEVRKRLVARRLLLKVTSRNGNDGEKHST